MERRLIDGESGRFDTAEVGAYRGRCLVQRPKTSGPRSEQPHNDPQERIRRNSPIATAGEVFPNGVILELVWGSTQAARLNLLAWDGTNAKLEPRAEHGDQVYVPPAPDPTILNALELPTIRKIFLLLWWRWPSS